MSINKYFKAISIAGICTVISFTSLAFSTHTSTVSLAQVNVEDSWKDAFVTGLQESIAQRMNNGKVIKIDVNTIGLINKNSQASSGVKVRLVSDSRLGGSDYSTTQTRIIGNSRPMSSTIGVSFDYTILDKTGAVISTGTADLNKRVTANAFRANSKDSTPLYIAIVDDWLNTTLEN